jgi:uncharacterized protein YdeI (YjbR/CyaY-like superfamily)
VNVAQSEFQRVEVTSRESWRSWLLAHHGQAQSIWLVTWKKAHADRYVPAEAIVEEALAFGWIDSRPRALDADRTMRLLSPRRAGSAWSRVNKGKVEALMARGALHPAGLAAIERAKADGSWSRIDGVETLEEPADLKRALRADPRAAGHWKAFPPSTRRAILEWIHSAKTPATRQRRLDQTVTEAHLNRRANQARQPKSNREQSR